MAKFLMKFGIKASILTGAVYYTIDQGLWEDTEKADEVYSRLYNAISPYISESHIEVPELPSAADISQCSRFFYNRGVIASAEFIKEMPSTVKKWGSSLQSSMSNLLEASSSEVASLNSPQKSA